ncbi:MAG: fibrobacter succinogenes major paralogous domain-containing protein [Bacteroidales bacterium]|nr:fibrobacter succinogenes major paralogous domain-containing protein [Bacteroidales bacterium]
MRKIIFLLCTVTLFFVACNKEEDDSSPVTPDAPSDTTQVDPPIDGWIPQAVTDIDGNVYDAVQIGDHVWMVQNLRTTRYANGDDIPAGSMDSYSEPYRYVPDNDEGNVPNYGYLYNWPAVMHGAASSNTNPSEVQGICPDGWHVPSDAEWTQLTDFVSAQSQFQCNSNSSNIAKALAGTMGWNSSTITCAVGNTPSDNNTTGFSGLPAGYYDGNYGGFGDNANFWSATKLDNSHAHRRSLRYSSASVSRTSPTLHYSLSVRCVRD